MAATNFSCGMNDLTSEELFEEVSKSAVAITTIVLLTATSILTLGMFIESVINANKKIPISRRRVRLIVLMGIYPTMSMTSMISLYVPAAHLLNSLVASVYFSVALFQFLMLIIDYYGGKAAVVEKLKDQRISLASPPLTCCCPCWMPKINMTPPNLRNLRRVVMQVAFVRPLLFFISLVLWTDGKYTHGAIAIDEPYIYITTVSTISGLLALYGIILFLTASLEPLRSFRIRPKFLIVQMVLILISTQNLILAILADVYVIPCVAPFSADSRANYIGDMMIIVEMLFFSVLSRMYFRGRFGNIDLIDVNAPMGGRLTSFGPYAYAVVTSDQEKPNGTTGKVEMYGNAEFAVENEKSGEQTTNLERPNATEA